MLWSAALKGLKDCFLLGKAAPLSGTLKGLKVCSSLGKVVLWSAALKGLKDCFSLGKAAPWSGTLKGLKVCSSLGKVALKGLEVCSSLGKVVVWFGALKVLKVCCWVAVLGFCSLRRRPLYRLSSPLLLVGIKKRICWYLRHSFERNNWQRWWYDCSKLTNNKLWGDCPYLYLNTKVSDTTC